MTKDEILVKLRNLLGATPAEMLLIAILLLGLLIGLIAKSFDQGAGKDNSNKDMAEIVYNSLDSLAEAQKATYTGTDIHNNVAVTAEKQAESNLGKKDSKSVKSGGSKININTASKTQLMTIPGVGDKTALNIMDYRKNSPFRKAEDIMNIRGIGAKKFEKMKPFIEVK